MRKAKGRDESGPREAVKTPRASDAVPAGAGSRVLDEVSAPHARVPEPVPAAWLDRLLAAVLDLPLSSGERAVVTAMVDAVAAILPDHAVAACVVPEPGSMTHGQVVVKRIPEGLVASQPGVDPTRVFPGFTHEYVAPLPGSTTGSTFHVASNDDALGRRSPALHLVERAAFALGRALEHARQLGILASVRTDATVFDERMVQADKLATFGQIAAGIVHELNNPLTSIVAYSDYLIRRAVSGERADGDAKRPEDPEQLESLRRISESANRMLRFTRDFVTYARPSSGAPGPVVLHGIIDQSVAFCEHVLAAAGVGVEKRYGAEVRAVRGVGEQLVQVFVNLLTNASQAAPEQDGLIIVTTSFEPAERRVRIVVEDNGCGIAPEHLRQVFLPFFTTKGDRHGTGLGLSIVKSILEGHDGAIRVESEPGRGARFVLELPAWQRP
jgi:two-component system NtrC family sensor kinase